MLLILAFAAQESRSFAAPPERADGWRWPFEEFAVVATFEAPAHEYGPGHRGVDLRPEHPDSPVVAPAAGVIAFRGLVGDRHLVTIDHGNGLVTTLEPVRSEMSGGTVVARGETVGLLATGGHTSPGTLHVGVRSHGDYINPMVLTGSIPRAILLPCC